jgi:hypothetical protein
MRAMGWWRWQGAVGALVLAAAAVLLPSGSDSAEALTRVRARVTWTTVVPYLPTLRGYDDFLRDNPGEVGGAFTFFRDNTLSRRSNADPQQRQVLPGAPFTDEVRFMPTIDIVDAVLHVHQPGYGPNRDECHVVVTSISDNFGASVGPAIPPTGATELSLGRLAVASAPYTVELLSQVPRGSQRTRPTTKLFTSVIRVLERVPSRSAVPPPPPRLRACGGEIGGRGFNSLNKTLIIRTELQLSEWARANGRPTPTPVSRAG